jgi:hypothetical protein
MAFKVIAHNALDAFTDPNRAQDMVDFIADETVRPDIMFVSEAYDPRRTDGMAFRRAIGALGRLGYDVVAHAYQDTDRYGEPDKRKDVHGFIALNSIAGARSGVQRFNTRNGYRTMFRDPQTGQVVHGYGLHVKDRPADDQDHQFDDFRPARRARNFLIGDLNNAPVDTVVAGALRLVAPVFDRMCAGEPGTDQTKLERIASLGQRLGHMTRGILLEQLETEHGLRTAATQHIATKKMGPFPFVELDHILIDDGLEAPGGVNVYRGMPGSDHDPIEAELFIARR